MKLKHKIYKLIDISGLQLFDTIARILFKEEPKVQIKRITQFIIIPAVTFCLFLLMWQIMAPHHTTKSGEVPTPIRVVDAARGIWTFHKREKQKSEAFITTPEDSKKLIQISKERLNEIETKLIPAQEELINKLRKQNCYIEKRKQTDGYRKLLASHEVSVSNFGAGTFLDVNITKTPAVMIPNPIPRNSPSIYDEQGNVISNEEQFRAEKYEKVDNGKVLMYDNLNTSTLGTAIENAKKLKPKSFNMNGREFVRNLLCTN